MAWWQWPSQRLQAIRARMENRSSRLKETLYRAWNEAGDRAEPLYFRWQAVWKAWWHWMLDFRPVVRRIRLGVRGVPVHLVPAISAASHGLRFVQTLATHAVALTLSTRVSDAMKPHAILVVVHDAVAVILQQAVSRSLSMLGDTPLQCQSAALTRYSVSSQAQALLPKAGLATRSLQWPKFQSPSAFRLRRLTLSSPMAKALPQARIKGVVRSDDKKVWRQPLVRQPVAAHRFSIAERNVFREALAKKAGVTDASKILLTTVVDRIPGTQVAHMQSTEEGAVSYRLVPERKLVGQQAPAQTGVVVVGRHLQTRKTIRAFVPASDYLNLDAR